MTPWGRALLGAAFGAILTLAVHPVSRPYLEEAIVRYPADAIASLAGSDHPVLPLPDSAPNASEWLQVAADKFLHGQKLSQSELLTLLGLDQEGEEAQEDNAFWPQMRAVLLHLMGRNSEARESWRRASNCTRWDDGQSDRLLNERDRLVRTLGWNQAWTYGYVFFNRSDAAAAVIQHYAQKLVGSTTLDTAEGLRTRYYTIVNGDLLRDGSHSIKVGLHGYDMVERASYPPSLSGTPRPKRIWIAETILTARLRQAGMVEESRRAFEAFDHNDWWRALTGIDPGPTGPQGETHSLLRAALPDETPDENLRDLCLISIGLAGLPGAMGLASILGAGLLLVGSLLQARLSNIRFFPTLAITAVALSLGCLAFLATRLVPVGVCVAVTVEFLAVGPGTPRARRSDDLGPLFNLTMASTWLVLLGAFGLFICAVSSSARALGPELGPAGEYFTNSATFLGIATIALSMICLVSPLYATVRRFGTPDILALSLRRIGRFGAVVALTLCVIGGPATVLADRACARELRKIVENEPVYYMVPR